MTIHSMEQNEGYERFREEWLMDITAGSSSSVEKGIRFSKKLVRQWLDIGEEDNANESFFINDGPGDGGIDIAYLCRGEDDNGISGNEGDTWYLIQSKYGTSQLNVFDEGRKIIDTLCGSNSRLSENSERLVEKIKTFLKRSSENDRLELVIATSDPLDTNERNKLEDIKIIGRRKLEFAGTFDVKEISVKTIWQQQGNYLGPNINLKILGNFIDTDSNLIIGIIPIYNLYNFLDQYRKSSGDLDAIYDWNVRLYLGHGRNKINKGIKDTINNKPEMFGVYNNGITIVVSNFEKIGKEEYQLSDPQIVNGCQTTKIIWNTLDGMYNSGGTGELDVGTNLKKSFVIAKIIKTKEKSLQKEITKFTNSQTGVRGQDFLALEDEFRQLANEVGQKYNIFIEVQRGAWEAKQASDKQNPNINKLTYKGNDYIFDLLKVYGAGWLSSPGPAWNKKDMFLPQGSIFEKIMSREEDIPFGVDDIFAAYILKKAAANYGFGDKRHPKAGTRSKTTYVFYFVFVFILSNILKKYKKERPLRSELTQAIINLDSAGSTSDNTSAISELYRVSIEAIDEYMTDDEDTTSSIFKEENYKGDLNTFLKSNNLGNDKHSPLLLDLLNDMNRVLSRPSVGQEKSPSEIIFETSRTVENS